MQSKFQHYPTNTLYIMTRGLSICQIYSFCFFLHQFT
nr:MAG TPA: hypothetical protein [Caudoviricetes sp.]